jgi:putative polymerase
MMYYGQPENFSSPGSVASTGLSITDQRFIIGVMIAAVIYQAVLCLLNTMGIRTSAAFVGASEALIILACVPFLIRRLSKGAIVLALLAGAYVCLASLVTGQLNIKALRDLIIPLCFLWLGWNLGRPELVDRILKYIIAIVLFMGFFELLLLDTYTQFFDIFGYYISTGNLQPITEYERESRLQLNGIRPEGIGRTLLPGLLGSHRVSSVFLEPVSLGNFATLIAAWDLAAITMNGATVFSLLPVPLY